MRRVSILVFALTTLVWVGCSTSHTSDGNSSSSYRAEGEASYYSDKLHGNRTASGVAYDKDKMTAAHRKLPFGTQLRVTNLSNGRSVVVTVNDRGPFVDGRIVDVSRKAAEQLDFVRQGHARVRVEAVN